MRFNTDGFTSVPRVMCRLFLSQASPSAIGGLLTVQAGLLAVVEERLFVAGHVDEDDDVMYPGQYAMMVCTCGIRSAYQCTEG